MNKKLTVYVNHHLPNDEADLVLENLKLLVRLFIGASAEVVDELVCRVQERQTVIKQDPTSKMTIIPYDETDFDRLRYLFLGLLFEAPDRIVNRISTARKKARKAANLIDRMFSPLTNNFFMRSVRQRHEARVAKVEAIFNRLIDTGRFEETAGRRLARDTFDAAVDEFYAYLAQNPELRQILQRQSAGLTDEVVDQLRDRAATADKLVDRLAGAILRRSPLPTEAVSAEFVPPTKNE